MKFSREKTTLYLKYLLIGIFTLIVVVFIKQPIVVKYAFLLFPLAFYLLIRFSIHKSNILPDEYFLYEREMPIKQFIPSFVTTNIGLFSSVGFSVILCCYYGFQGMLWTTIAWFGGMYWFSRNIKSLLPFLRNGNTLHEYIAVRFGKTENHQNIIRGYTSIITFILYISSIGIEIKFSAQVLTPIFGISESLFIALLVTVVGVYCTYLSGYKGVVLTERLQYWIMIAMAFAIFCFVGKTMLTHPTLKLTREFWLGNGSKRFDISSMSILLLVYQFCVMDMWQRCIAVANSQTNQGKEDDTIIRELKKNTFRKAILPFLLFFIAFFSIGFVCIVHKISATDGNYLSPFVNLLSDNKSIELLLKSVIIVGFTAAAISTIDSFLIAAVQTFMYDIYGNLYKKGLSKNINLLPEIQQFRFTTISRSFVLVFGLCAILLAQFQFGFIQFWTSMYSIMLGFFPPVFFSLYFKEKEYRESGVLLGILLGSGTALLLGFIGTFIFQTSILTNLAPFSAISISFLFMLFSRKNA